MSESIFDRASPQWGIGAVMLITGFFLGRATASTTTTPQPSSHSTAKAQEIAEDDEDSDSDVDEDLKDFTAANEEYKLVLVVRTDLGMTKGIYNSQLPTSRLHTNSF